MASLVIAAACAGGSVRSAEPKDQFPEGYYGNVRYIREAGDYLGLEVRVYREGDQPMVEWVDCEGWCSSTIVAPLGRTEDGFVFEYDGYDSGYGSEGQLLHSRVELRWSRRGLLAYRAIEDMPFDETTGVQLKPLKESTGIALAHATVAEETGRNARPLLTSQNALQDTPVLGDTDLTGIVDLYDPTLGDLVGKQSPPEGGATVAMTFAFDDRGVPLRCGAGGQSGFAAGTSLELRRVVCDHVLAHGTFLPARNIDVRFGRGTAAMTLQVSWPVQPALPIRFVTPSDEGAQVAIEEDKNSERCQVFGSNMRLDHEQAVCEAWKAAGRPGSENVNATAGLLTAKIRVAVASGATKVDWLWVDAITDADREARWPVVLPPVERMIDPAIARIKTAILPDDYPTLAMRLGIAGRVSALVTFDEDGRAKACKPMSSTNTAFLGNVTCKVLLRRARVDVGGVPKWVWDNKSWVASVLWALPDD